MGTFLCSIEGTTDEFERDAKESSKENNIKHFNNEKKYDAEHDSSSEHFGMYVDIYM